MSKANSPVKVLKVALRRVQKAWGTGEWKIDTGKRDEGGKRIYAVCLQGAIFGYCSQPLTQPQRDALRILEDVAKEDYGERSIPGLNDSMLTQESAELLVKRAIIRAEGGGIIDPEEFYVNDEDIKGLI